MYIFQRKKCEENISFKKITEKAIERFTFNAA